MNKYTLSTEAQVDLEQIIDYSIFKFGENQAELFFIELESLFNMLADQPYTGRDRPELKTGLKSFTHKSHNIYYAINSNGIRIVRVLHHSRVIKDLF